MAASFDTRLTLGQLLNVVALIIVIGGGFHFTGKISATLDHLAKISQDHENRLRDLERANGP